MKWTIVLSILLLGCGAANEPCDCNCQTNPDGSLNFKVDTVNHTMVLKANGESYIKEDLRVEAAKLNTNERWAVWKTMKDGKNIKEDALIESLEACSLLHVWKTKGLYNLIGSDTTDVHLISDSVR